MITVREYLDVKGFSPFALWFEGLDAIAAAKVAAALYRLEQAAHAYWQDYKERKR